MKKKIQEIALECYSPYSNFDIEKFADLLIKDCIKAIKKTPEHCAYTTWDLGVVQCTIDKCVETVTNHFNEE